MKVLKIERDEDRIYHVTIRPSLIARLFGSKERVERYIDSGREYRLGNQTVYTNYNGERMENWSKVGEAIDNWRRRFPQPSNISPIKAEDIFNEHQIKTFQDEMNRMLKAIDKFTGTAKQ